MDVQSDYESETFLMPSHSEIKVTDPLQTELQDPLAIISVKPEDDDCMEDSVKVVEMVEQVEVNVIVGEHGAYLLDANGVQWYFPDASGLGVEQWTCQQKDSSTCNSVSQDDAQENKFFALDVCSECGGKLHRDMENGPPVCIKCTVGLAPTSTIFTQNVYKKHSSGQSLRKKHVCAICDKQFTRFVDLKDHSLSHTETSGAVKEKAPTRVSVKKPLVFAPEKLHVPCNVKKASRSTAKHKKKISEDLPFVCSACTEKFPDRETLGEHFLEHEEEDPFQCSLCSQHLMDKDELAVHSIVHNRELSPFLCEVCNKEFQTIARLRTHSYIHLKVKEYPCRKCKKRFSQLQELKKHANIHGSRPYVCNTCQREFKRSGHLKRHYCPQRGRLIIGDQRKDCQQ